VLERSEGLRTASSPTTCSIRSLMPPLAMPALLSGCFAAQPARLTAKITRRSLMTSSLDAAEDAREDARAQIKQKSLDSLTQHQRVVYDIVRDHGPSDQAKFTTAILRRSTTHRRSGLFTYLSKMPQYNLLEAEGTSRDREFHSSIRQRPHRCSKLLSVSSNSLHTRHMANFSR